MLHTLPLPNPHLVRRCVLEEQGEDEPNERRYSDGDDRPLHEELDLRLDITGAVAANVHIPGGQLDGEAEELEQGVDLCRHLHKVDLWDQCGYLES